MTRNDVRPRRELTTQAKGPGSETYFVDSLVDSLVDSFVLSIPASLRMLVTTTSQLTRIERVECIWCA